MLKLAVIVCLAVLICLMTACRRGQDNVNEPYTQIDTEGIGWTAHTSRAEYFFMENSDDNDNRNWVRNAETIIAAAERQGIRQSDEFISLHFVDSNFALTPAFVSINVDNPAQIGGFTQYLSGFRLPAWLSSGLELYWLELDNAEMLPGGFVIQSDIDVSAVISNIREIGLPEFGDLWYLPGYISDSIVEYAPRIAVAFVRHLSENNQLDEVVSFYMNGNFPAHLDVMAMAWWTDFFGTPQNTEAYDINFQATFGMSFAEMFHSLFITRSDMSTIYFSADYSLSPIDYDVIRGYYDILNTAMRFTKDWLGFTGHPPVDIIVYPAFFTRTLTSIANHLPFIGNDTERDFGLDIQRTTYFAAAPEPTGAIAVHGAASVLLRREDIWSNFPRSPGTMYSNLLIDGLGEYLLHLFQHYHMEHEDIMTSISIRSFIQRMSEDEFAFLEETYAARAGLPFGEEPFNIIEYVHSLAIWDLQRQNEQHFSNLHEIFTQSGMNPDYQFVRFISSYHAAGSFVAYLLSIGTRNDFMAFYVDYRLAEEIYGRSIDELAGDWIEFLGVTIFH